MTCMGTHPLKNLDAKVVAEGTLEVVEVVDHIVHPHPTTEV